MMCEIKNHYRISWEGTGAYFSQTNWADYIIDTSNLYSAIQIRDWHTANLTKISIALDISEQLRKYPIPAKTS